MASKTHHKIILADSRWMTELDDASVHLVVTSPPYWQLKDYGHRGQIGFDDTYEQYINNLNLVWSECARVLHPGCRLCVNIGDQFARSVTYGRYKVIPIRTEIVKFCESAGFDFMGSIVWQKVTTTHTTGGGSVMGSYPYPRNGIVKIDYEHILLFKKYGDAPKPTRAQKEASRLTDEEWNTCFSGHWNFGGERQMQHLAMFPEELPKRLIKMFTFVGEIVLDPFLGSGTTALAAKHLGRNSVGFEINRQFLPVIREKVGGRESHIERGSYLEVVERTLVPDTLEERIRLLPYVFHDPVQVEKQIDPREQSFGSKVNGSEEADEQLFSVASVPAGHILELSDGQVVELLGVHPAPGKDQAACAYLRQATKGQRVILKFDEENVPSNGTPKAYVYKKDKTLLNAHLIKKGLLGPDPSIKHRMSKRFQRYADSASDPV